MSVADHKQLARRWVEEIWNQGRAETINEIIAPNYVNYSAPELPRGPEGYRHIVAAFRGAFSDFHLVLEDLLAEANKVAVRWTMHGKHTGEFSGVAPTGKQVTFTGIAILRIAAGQIEE